MAGGLAVAQVIADILQGVGMVAGTVVQGVGQKREREALQAAGEEAKRMAYSESKEGKRRWDLEFGQQKKLTDLSLLKDAASVIQNKARENAQFRSLLKSSWFGGK